MKKNNISDDFDTALKKQQDESIITQLRIIDSKLEIMITVLREIREENKKQLRRQQNEQVD